MIRLGKHVTQSGDQLLDVAMDKLYRAILNPSGEVASLQKRLQAVRAIDPSQYRKMKTSLPYVVCADFHPKTRRKENFLHTERFILDLDHISEANFDLEVLRNQFQADPRVELAYASPSGDGLKLFFRLSRSISDPAYYAAFYKAFALRLQSQYGLEQVLDGKTHDVSRCCFVSFDPNAFYNPEAEQINTEEYLRKEDLYALDELRLAIKEAENIQKSEGKDKPNALSNPLPDDTIRRIKEKMGLKIKAPRHKDYIQPEALEGIMTQMKDVLQEVELTLISADPISYGRKCKISSPNLNIWAELNVFLGKRGLSFVPTTKTGSDKELAKEIVAYLNSTINPLLN